MLVDVWIDSKRNTASKIYVKQPLDENVPCHLMAGDVFLRSASLLFLELDALLEAGPFFTLDDAQAP